MTLSIVLPAKNEAEGLRRTLPALRLAYPDAEIIVVDDGSTDETAAVAAAAGAEVLSSPYSMGNGAAIKRGARMAGGDVLVFMDADGQHGAEHVAALLGKLDEGYYMVVGARERSGQANLHRGLANAFYNRLASWMTGHQVVDLTSGFRAVRADKFREFLHLLPNGFSYPTTSTMAFFGVGLAYYGYTFTTMGRFTIMCTLLFSASVIVFLIGLVSEQITGLTYLSARSERDEA